MPYFGSDYEDSEREMNRIRDLQTSKEKMKARKDIQNLFGEYSVATGRNGEAAATLLLAHVMLDVLDAVKDLKKTFVVGGPLNQGENNDSEEPKSDGPDQTKG